MRYLAIDLGGKRTGLAVGDDASGMVSPIGVIEAKQPAHRMEQIAIAIAEHQPEALVVGLPLNMDDSEGPAAKAARQAAAELEARFKLPVHLVDERLTSFAADEQMRGSGLTRGRKKSLRDALAAAAILRDFLTRGKAPR